MPAAPGITPAYAGKRQATERCSIAGQDHPRLCGEKACLDCRQPARLGSPPPMRGKVIIIICQDDFIRITPAYAGKRCASDGIWRIWQDHPRLCGEKDGSLIFEMAVMGSPPPMRGKVAIPVNVSQQFRITPAYAGKRIVVLRVPFCFEDHPRLCGEKVNSMSLETT